MSRHVLAVIVIGVLSLAGPALAATPNTSARSALGKVIPAVNFQNVTLRDALDFLRDISNVNFHVNAKALDGAGVSLDTPVNMKLRNVTLKKVLNLLLTEAAGGPTLTWYLEDGVIEVTTKELADSQMFIIVYDVEDLLIQPPSIMPSMIGMMGGMGGGGYGGGGYGGGGYGGSSYGGSSIGGSSFGGGGYGGGGYGGGGYGGGGFGGGGFGGGMMGGGMMGGGMMGGMGMGGGAGGLNGAQRTQLEQDLMDLIMETVQPDAWDPNTGQVSSGSMGSMGSMSGMGGMGGMSGGRSSRSSRSNKSMPGMKMDGDSSDSGGKATLRFFNGKLVVNAPRSVHEALAGPMD